jgi:predicted chitinase
MPITEQQLLQLLQILPSFGVLFLLNTAIVKYGIVTPLHMAAFIA